MFLCFSTPDPNNYYTTAEPDNMLRMQSSRLDCVCRTRYMSKVAGQNPSGLQFDMVV